jgi:hypothetical protein
MKVGISLGKGQFGIGEKILFLVLVNRHWVYNVVRENFRQGHWKKDTDG